jgi:hypothetical protein
MGHRQLNFCCQHWRSHPQGLGVYYKNFGGTLNKAGGEDDEIQWKPHKNTRLA